LERFEFGDAGALFVWAFAFGLGFILRVVTQINHQRKLKIRIKPPYRKKVFSSSQVKNQ
jgi:hypothetical protein